MSAGRATSASSTRILVRRWTAALVADSALTVTPATFAADAPRTLHAAFPVAETGFDPQAIGDTYSDAVCLGIFDPLYRYDYFARPVVLEPNTADGMPEITDGGRTYTIKVKRGIFFAADPAFNGKKRELTAQDYVYSIKRVFDPKVRSYWLYVFEQTLVGLEGPLERARKSGKFDYDEKIEGLQALDRYTLQLKLTAVDYTLLERLAILGTFAVAREVVEAAGADILSRPVGTGPFKLAEWRRASRVVLDANPDYRPFSFPESNDPALAPLARAMKGRTLPALSRIEISIMAEQVPELLAFEQGSLDYVLLTGTIVSRLLDNGKLKPDLAKRGIGHIRFTVPALIFTYFNQEDPVVGGNQPERIALRRAIAMGFNNGQFIQGIYGGHALPANQLLPVGVDGHDPKLPPKSMYDPVAARALLDRFGFRDRDGDGYRELPDGKPLVLVQSSETSSLSREADTLWLKNMTAIGLRMTINTQQFNDLLRQSKAGQLMMFNLGNRSAGPSGYNILGLLWGKAPVDQNHSRFRNADYDAAYEKFLRTPEGPERTALARRMSDIAANYVPLMMQVYPVGHAFTQPWLLGWYPSAFGFTWKYVDIDMAKRAAAGR
jgi:ABC-type transport system substrate-binding protein